MGTSKFLGTLRRVTFCMVALSVSAGCDSKIPTEDITIAPGGDPAPAAAANNALGLAVYRELSAKEGNLAFSPASLSIALDMTVLGASGDTANEMKSVLQFPSDSDAVHRGWATLLSGWQQAKGVELAVANRVFGDESMRFADPFTESCRTHYGAPPVALDFRGEPGAARQHINAWVTEKTRKRIPELLPDGSVDEETAVVLVNAIYFNAKWLSRFNERSTKPRAFATPSGDVMVPMMSQEGQLEYGVLEDVELAQLRYEADLAALFVLPKPGTQLADIEKELTPDRLATWAKSVHRMKVDMQLPRFKLAQSKPVNLSKTLKGMGMVSAFDPERADFTAMGTLSEGQRRVRLRDVYQKVFIEMMEGGTEAAAATGASGVGTKSAGGPAEFHANRPFLFFVRDTKSGLVLFSGRVTNPSMN